MSALPDERRSTAPQDDAARRLYERYSNRIFRYCLQRLGSLEEAEDAAQTTFLYAFLGLRRGVEPEFEVAWLYKIAENVSRTRLRASARRGRFEAAGDLLGLIDLVPAAQPSGDHEKIEALPEVLSRMPPSQRRALLLREVQGLSYREIAAQLRTSVSAVETLLFRARRSCARELERLERPSQTLLSTATLASTVRSLWSRYVAASGGVKAATVAAAVAAGGAVAVAPQLARHVPDARAGAVAPRLQQAERPATPAVRRASRPGPESRPGVRRFARPTPTGGTMHAGRIEASASSAPSIAAAAATSPSDASPQPTATPPGAPSEPQPPPPSAPPAPRPTTPAATTPATTTPAATTPATTTPAVPELPVSPPPTPTPTIPALPSVVQAPPVPVPVPVPTAAPVELPSLP